VSAVSHAPGPQRPVTIDAVAVFVVLLLIVQMWLLTATLDSYLGGHRDVALPAFVASTALFFLGLGLYGLVLRIDRASAADDQKEAEGPWLI
jgi:FtsH-binding integral membrane protein